MSSDPLALAVDSEEARLIDPRIQSTRPGEGHTRLPQRQHLRIGSGSTDDCSHTQQNLKQQGFVRLDVHTHCGIVDDNRKHYQGLSKVHHAHAPTPTSRRRMHQKAPVRARSLRKQLKSAWSGASESLLRNPRSVRSPPQYAGGFRIAGGWGKRRGFALHLPIKRLFLQAAPRAPLQAE